VRPVPASSPRYRRRRTRQLPIRLPIRCRSWRRPRHGAYQRVLLPYVPRARLRRFRALARRALAARRRLSLTSGVPNTRCHPRRARRGLDGVPNIRCQPRRTRPGGRRGPVRRRNQVDGRKSCLGLGPLPGFQNLRPPNGWRALRGLVRPDGARRAPVRLPPNGWNGVRRRACPGRGVRDRPPPVPAGRRRQADGRNRRRREARGAPPPAPECRRDRPKAPDPRRNIREPGEDRREAPAPRPDRRKMPARRPVPVPERRKTRERLPFPARVLRFGPALPLRRNADPAPLRMRAAGPPGRVPLRPCRPRNGEPGVFALRRQFFCQASENPFRPCCRRSRRSRALPDHGPQKCRRTCGYLYTA